MPRLLDSEPFNDMIQAIIESIVGIMIKCTEYDFTDVRGYLDVPLPTYPYGKSLYKPYIGYLWVIIPKNP